MSEKPQSNYRGNGTDEDPYLVEFQEGDGLNPKEFSSLRKWFTTTIITVSVFAVTLTSAAYSSSAKEIIKDLRTSSELFAAGISLYVLGFALGPALWAPLAELYGRRILNVTTLAAATAFTGATAGSSNIATVLVLRFLTGTFAASPLTNAGGTIADVYPMSKAGVPFAYFSAAPFLGPVVGPLIGGFVSITIGWRWLQGICCIFIGCMWILVTFLLPETYGPVILRKHAKQKEKLTGKRFVSVLDQDNTKTSFAQVFGQGLTRPWVLLFREPIVLISSIYLAILYATIYMFLPAFSIVYEQHRGWNAGAGGLAFLGVIVGLLIGLAYTIFDELHRYRHIASPSPEDRLPPAKIGALAIPIGLFGFAWTNAPSVHWSASIILSSIFGFGLLPVFTLIIEYCVQSYAIYASSVIAAGAILRSLIGAAFPLFTNQMFANLGLHWAASIPAFLTVACIPFPFVMHKYGASIRQKCKYAHQAAVALDRMQGKTQDSDEAESDS